MTEPRALIAAACSASEPMPRARCQTPRSVSRAKAAWAANEIEDDSERGAGLAAV